MKQFEVSEECWNTAELNEPFECDNVKGLLLTKRATEGKFYVILTEYTEI